MTGAASAVTTLRRDTNANIIIIIITSCSDMMEKTLPVGKYLSLSLSLSSLFICELSPVYCDYASTQLFIVLMSHFCYISVVYAHESMSQQLQPVESCLLLKTFLLLCKRLEVLKQHWITSKLGVSSSQTYRQYVTYWLVFTCSFLFQFQFQLNLVYLVNFHH